MKIQDFITHLKQFFYQQIIAVQELEPEPGLWQTLKKNLPQQITRILKEAGITRLYNHQAQAIESIRAGCDTAVLTPSASGKTLIYNLPILEAILKNPKTRALYLFPTKALAQDQAANIIEFVKKLKKNSIKVEIFDGDTSSYRRRQIKNNPPQILISNPDMLHLSLLAHHVQWAKFLKDLKFVVVDEAHYYRGVIGSHLHQIIQRFKRILEEYGTKPQFLALSATLANPAEFLNKLFDTEFKIIAKSGAPRGKKYFIFWKPIGSAYQEAKRIFLESVKNNFKTIAFTKSRKITELIYSWAVSESPKLREKISAYRAGYLPKERREIEKKLFNDELLGVVATSALELGIDVGSLDVCILVGYPGTLISTWQRIGRVGRGQQPALIILVGLEDALDSYFLSHPEHLLSGKLESALIDDQNEIIVEGHLLCAAREKILRAEEEIVRKHPRVMAKLTREGKLWQTQDGKTFFTKIPRPHHEVNLRSIGESFRIRNINTGQIIGYIEYPRVLRECYPGAIYLHAGEQWQVKNLDMAEKNVLVKDVEVDYFTEPRTHEEVEIIRVLKKKISADLEICFGEIKVTEIVRSFVRKKISDQSPQEEIPLNLEPFIFETKGMWLNIPEEIKETLQQKYLDFPGSLHGLEHALIATTPIFILCDRFDLGGVSYQFFPEAAGSLIFIYDAYPGGIGLTEKGFEIIGHLFESARELVGQCTCEDGCPSCIQSPKCGNGNEPLDKFGAVLLLKFLAKRALELKEIKIEEKVAVESRAAARGQKIVFLDCETQRLFAEVGGRFPEKLGISLVVTYDSAKKEYFYFDEPNVFKLLDQIASADLVVGFNILSFDWPALQPYFDFDLSKIATFDILDHIYQRLGFRISLNSLGRTTLGHEKSADGIQAVEWYRQGELGKLKEYCRQDVELIKELYEFGKKYGYLLIERNQTICRLPVEW